jgi:uncharacterized protein YjlB
MAITGRRTFNLLLAALNLRANRFAMAQGNMKAPDVLRLTRNGWMPNNETLPTLVYRSAMSPVPGGLAAHLESVFRKNGWPAQWRNGVYDFHHYHSTAHEVLGIAAGEGRVILGGENGRVVTVRAGDVLVLPAGTGHCRLDSSSDFLVIGAYPPDQRWDICRNAPSAEAVERMKRLPFPHSDPVAGGAGPLTKLWRS